MGRAAAIAWALFAACAVDVLTLPASAGPLQVGARAALGALSFVFAFAESLRRLGHAQGTRAALYPPRAQAEVPQGARLRLVRTASLGPAELHD